MAVHLPIFAMVSLASFMIRGGIAFVVVPKTRIVEKDRTIYRQLKCQMIDTIYKGSLVLNMTSGPEPDDTFRVRIWRVLAASFGEELTLKQLGAEVGERRTGELRNHLKHVKKQSESLRNKNNEWKERRGLEISAIKRTDKLRVRIRRGKKNEIYIKLA